MRKVNRLIEGCYDEQRLRYALKRASTKELREWLQWHTVQSYASEPRDACVDIVILTHVRRRDPKFKLAKV